MVHDVDWYRWWLIVLVDSEDIHYTRWGGVAGVAVGVEWGGALADEAGVDHIEVTWDPPSIVLEETKMAHKETIHRHTLCSWPQTNTKTCVKEQNNKNIDHIEATWDPPSIVLKETLLVGQKKIILPQTRALFLVYLSSWYLFASE